MDDFFFFNFSFKSAFKGLLPENKHLQVSDSVSREVEVFCHQLGSLFAIDVSYVHSFCHIEIARSVQYRRQRVTVGR